MVFRGGVGMMDVCEGLSVCVILYLESPHCVYWLGYIIDLIMIILVTLKAKWKPIF